MKHGTPTRLLGAAIALAGFVVLVLSGLPAPAFVNVTVVPVDEDRLLEDHTVVVVGEQISAVGPSDEVTVPLDAEVIQGEGRFLLPGLADMHAHLNVDPDPDFMRLFLAEGVTTLRNLNALPEHLRWREEVLRGERIGPTIYTSGPVIVGPPDRSIVWTFRALVIVGLMAAGAAIWILLWLISRVRGDNEAAQRLMRGTPLAALLLVVVGALLIGTKTIPINAYTSHEYPFAYVPDTEQQARVEVQRQADVGYDLVKIYDYLPRDHYLGAIEEARAQGIYSVAHLDHGLEDPLAAGLREIVHVDELLEEHLIGEASPGEFEPIPIDVESVPDTVASVVEHDALVVSNMAADVVTYEFLEAGPSYLKRPCEPGKVRDVIEEKRSAWTRRTRPDST